MLFNQNKGNKAGAATLTNVLENTAAQQRRSYDLASDAVISANNSKCVWM